MAPAVIITEPNLLVLPRSVAHIRENIADIHTPDNAFYLFYCSWVCYLKILIDLIAGAGGGGYQRNDYLTFIRRNRFPPYC